MNSVVSVANLKNRFESLKTTNDDLQTLESQSLRIKRSSPVKFQRSATCIDFSKLKIDNDDDDEQMSEEPPKENKEPKFQFQRQTSNSSNASYKSVRRSPAFRLDKQNKPQLAKPASPPKDKTEVDELEYLQTSETIKKALRSPLPTGPPPKKPPRAFNLPVLDAEIIKKFEQKRKVSPNTLPSTKRISKPEEKKSISQFFNCIVAPCHANDPIYYEQMKNEQYRQQEAEETIYMEPYAHLNKDFDNNNSSSSCSSNKNEELHYMVTVLDASTSSSTAAAEVNGNSTEISAECNQSSTAEVENYDRVKTA